MAQGRFNDALNNLMLHLAQEPECVDGHMLTALCFAQLDLDDDALEHAEKAVTLAPDFPPAYVILGKIQLNRDKYKLARAAAEEAIALDPDEAEAWALKAASHAATSEWKEVLAAAEKGLSIDPSHDLSRNYCVIALTKLGRKEEAQAAAYGALADDPENPLTHANTGWAHLHRGKAKDAIPHFRESLRLDPGNEWARAGFVEAMKSRTFVYAMFLRFFLWMSGFKPNVRLGLIIGAVVMVNVIGRIGDSLPALKPVAEGIQVAYVLFVIGVWISSPLFDALLLFNKEGRHALTRRQRVTAVVLLVTLACSTLFAGWVMSSNPFNFWGALFFYFILFPVMMTCRSRIGWPLAFSITYTVVIMGFFLAPYVIPGVQTLRYYAYGCIISSWLSSVIPSD